jgi:hypothetical protein
MSETPTGWGGILEEGETIQWQGRPSSRIIWRDLLSPQTFMGVFFCVFSAFWLKGVFWMMDRTPRNGATDMLVLFPFVGSVFFVAGLYMLIGRLLWDAWVRRSTWYTLTNKAAYVATQTFGRRKLKRYRRANMIDPRLVDEHPGSVFFASETQTYSSRGRSRAGHMRQRRTHTYQIPIGFRQIDDPRAVYRLLIDSRYNDDAADTA